MRNRALYTAVVFLAGLLVSCQQLGQETDSGAEAIYLKAGVSQAVETRAPYTLTTPTSAAPLEVSVWARTGGHTYQNLGYNGKTPGHENEVAIHTSARFQSGETPQLLTDAVYPQDPGGGAPPPVYFVALHPLTSWVNENTAGTADYNYASYTFDGKTDVLFAPQVSGHYNMGIENSPTFHFFHMLTWLRIEVKVQGATVQEREAVRDAWGKITSLELSGTKNRLTIDLSTPPPDISSGTAATRIGNVAAKANYNGSSVSMPVYATGTETAFPGGSGYTIPTSASMTEVAYVLCAPVIASTGTTDEYTLRVETEHRPDPVDIPVDLKVAAGTNYEDYYTGTTMGRQFTLSLTFKLGNTIAVSSTVNDWITGGLGNVDITED